MVAIVWAIALFPDDKMANNKVGRMKTGTCDLIDIQDIDIPQALRRDSDRDYTPYEITLMISRSYVWLYKLTGQAHYLVKARDILKIIKYQRVA